MIIGLCFWNETLQLVFQKFYKIYDGCSLLARKRSSCKMHTAFSTSIDASNKFHKEMAIPTHQYYSKTKIKIYWTNMTVNWENDTYASLVCCHRVITRKEMIKWNDHQNCPSSSSLLRVPRYEGKIKGNQTPSEGKLGDLWSYRARRAQLSECSIRYFRVLGCSINQFWG